VYLRQSTASQLIDLGPFLDDTDGKTAETALTIANTDIKLRKAGATAAVNKNSGGATHDAGGNYYATLDATDTNTVGPLVVKVHVSGALPVRAVFQVLEEAIYDALFAASASAFDANGRVRHVVGTGAGEINSSGGVVPASGNWATAGAQMDLVNAPNATAVTAIKSGLSTHSAADVWSVTTRRLSDGTNIVLAKGTGVTGFNDIAAGTAMTLTSGERTAVANEVEAQIIDETDSEKVLTAITDKIASVNPSLSGLTLSAIASAVWSNGTRVLTAGTNIDGSTFTNIPWNASWDAEVQSEVADALAVYDPPTNAEMEARTLAAASYATAATQTSHTTTLTNIAGVVVTKLDTALEQDGAVYRFTINALEQAPAGGGGGGGTDWSSGEREQIRKALGITGTTAATTGTGLIDAIKAKTDTLGSTTAQYSNPVDVEDADRLTLVQGDSHAAGDRVPTWTITGYAGPALAAGGKLRLLPTSRYRMRGTSAEAELEVDATVATAGTTLTVTAPISAAQAETLATSYPPVDRESHQYQLIGYTASGGHPVTLKLAIATVLRSIDEAA
jgi:hypothetical protein